MDFFGHVSGGKPDLRHKLDRLVENDVKSQRHLNTNKDFCHHLSSRCRPAQHQVQSARRSTQWAETINVLFAKLRLLALNMSQDICDHVRSFSIWPLHSESLPGAALHSERALVHILYFASAYFGLEYLPLNYAIQTREIAHINVNIVETNLLEGEYSIILLCFIRCLTLP